MKCIAWVLSGLLLLEIVYGQGLAGKYYLEANAQLVALEFRTNDHGQVSGMFTSTRGKTFSLKGHEEYGDASGTATLGQSTLAFEAILDGNEIYLILSPEEGHGKTYEYMLYRMGTLPGDNLELIPKSWPNEVDPDEDWESLGDEDLEEDYREP